MRHPLIHIINQHKLRLFAFRGIDELQTLTFQHCRFISWEIQRSVRICVFFGVEFGDFVDGFSWVDYDGVFFVFRRKAPVFPRLSGVCWERGEGSGLKKFWNSAGVRFGREIEALLGSSARYATANYNAFSQLAWSADDIEVLMEQWQQTVGIREVPGGYYTGRHITNAIRKVINDKDDPRETVLDYAITINEELTKKRTEFGLPTE